MTRASEPAFAFTSVKKLGLALIAITLVFALYWFGGLDLRGLFDPDEGRYAEIPREMLAAGDWVTPRLNGLKYFEKPPFQYWLTAIAFWAFGEDEWTARLPAATLGFLAVLMLGFTAYRLRGIRTGVFASIVLGSSWGYFLGAQYLTLDMTLTALLTVVLCALLLAQSEPRKTNWRPTWMMAAWIAMGLAVLSKGLVAIVLPAVAIAGYAAARRDLGILRRLNVIRGSAAMLVVTLPWFILVQYRNPDFFQFFFVEEHLRRYTLPGHSRPGAWWYFIPVIIVGLMPWTPILAKAIVRKQKATRPAVKHFSLEWFCATWALVIVLFFSASHSKLPAYVLPAVPAIALLVAISLERDPRGCLKWSAWGNALLGVLLLGVVALAPNWSKFAAIGPQAAGAKGWLFAACTMLSVGGLAAAWLAAQRRIFASMLLLALTSLSFWQLAFAFLAADDPQFSSERLIERLTEDNRPFHPEAPFFSVAQFDPSVPFYLGRTVTLVATRGELGPGIDAEPAKAVASIDEFRRTWLNLNVQAFAILPIAKAAELRQKGLPMLEIAHDRRLSIVSRYQRDAEPPPTPNDNKGK
jgi:4-amino-4-deoxy-L-arabinose transferase-like glycosyltransferase